MFQKFQARPHMRMQEQASVPYNTHRHAHTHINTSHTHKHHVHKHKKTHTTYIHTYTHSHTYTKTPTHTTHRHTHTFCVQHEETTAAVASHHGTFLHERRAGQDRKYTPYMTVYLGLARTMYICTGSFIVCLAGKPPNVRRVGQNHVYTVYIRYF